MNITIIGAGYVGLVTGACFAELGNHVTCVDLNKEKVDQLKKGILPIYEPGLEAMVVSNIAENRLHFVTAIEEQAVEPQVIFIAVGTPSDKDGAADMQYVEMAARNIGSYIKNYCAIVDKSTVPVGMADRVKTIIQQELKCRKLAVKFDIVSNPEFLREGAAIKDFMQPDRVIIGLSSKKAKSIMLDLYLPIMRNPEKIYFMNVKDAEMTKYAANAMLATRISFMNEMAVLCERLDVDIENVRIGLGSDARIGSAFINAGCGYGGSCFPKDVRALINMAERHGMDPIILNAVEKRNFLQKQILHEKLQYIFGQDLSNTTIAVWGLAFKPGTDDMREASSLVLLENVLKRGAQVQAYDPVAIPVAKQMLAPHWLSSGQITFTDHPYDALDNVDALVLVTEWMSFCYPDLSAMKKRMRRHIIIDGRNQYDPKQIKEAGFEYYGIGR
ncbi:MAG: UDP-glucose 6-dehydrogenase [Gammaproteobacteria bacterium RIFCSPHIGHO2_12_FULL_42_13]|nr:MAG: UDP-glucose 6-dehydrogenase [Gammaproteobacteria bacterium RIFCSPHIGHO2_12_FULL_42_13]